MTKYRSHIMLVGAIIFLSSVTIPIVTTYAEKTRETNEHNTQFEIVQEEIRQVKEKVEMLSKHEESERIYQIRNQILKVSQQIEDLTGEKVVLRKDVKSRLENVYPTIVESNSCEELKAHLRNKIAETVKRILEIKLEEEEKSLEDLQLKQVSSEVRAENFGDWYLAIKEDKNLEALQLKQERSEVRAENFGDWYLAIKEESQKNTKRAQEHESQESVISMMQKIKMLEEDCLRTRLEKEKETESEIVIKDLETLPFAPIQKGIRGAKSVPVEKADHVSKEKREKGEQGKMPSAIVTSVIIILIIIVIGFLIFAYQKKDKWNIEKKNQ